MAAKTYSTKSNARAGAKAAGIPEDRIDLVEVAGGRWMWMDKGEAETEAEAAPQEGQTPAPAEAGEVGGTEGEDEDFEDDQSMEAIAARNEARRREAEEMEAERLLAQDKEAAQDAYTDAAFSDEAPAEGEAPANGEAVASMKAALLAGLVQPRAAGPALDENDPRMAEEYACTFSLTCKPALAAEIARFISRKASHPVRVDWAGDFPLGWTQEPGRAPRQPRAERPARERREGRGPGRPRQERDWTVKPTITSASNQGVQRLIDKIAAAEGDAAALRALNRFSRSSTYYKMAGNYLDALLAKAEAAEGSDAKAAA